MDFESRRQRILDKMEDNSIAILYLCIASAASKKVRD